MTLRTKNRDLAFPVPAHKVANDNGEIRNIVLNPSSPFAYSRTCTYVSLILVDRAPRTNRWLQVDLLHPTL